jgi:chromosome segregation protein
MLSALELAGFKSFADRTRFDFPDGITVIVGPNGSGKSNVVDAIKWVLGAQSAKALRGKDMTDVIFKGSTASGRKAANSAEATLIFDNSQKLLGIDADEVHVTRRVYRSGEGEYLINNQACRLKDIKDLFRGTGVGVDAYSLIEQGKVDRMLQASPKDRRVIFEEAAGISRFNAKKAEALRRLERVDQNLNRLKDIVDEVRMRLNSLKSQATKAQRYREMTSRLHTLRLRLGWSEYSELQEKAVAIATSLTELADEHSAREQELLTARDEAQRAEQSLHTVASECQQVEAVLQDTSQRIAVGRNQQQSLRQAMAEILAEQHRQQNKLISLRNRANSIHDEVQVANSQALAARQLYEQALHSEEQATKRLTLLRDEVSTRSSRHENLRKEHLALLREVSERTAHIAHKENQFAEIVQAIYTTEKQLADTQSAEHSARRAAESAAERLKQIHERNNLTASQLNQAKSELDDYRQQLSQNLEQAAVLQGRMEGAAERLDILEQLEQHLEGVDAGARYLLDVAQNSDDPTFRSVRGLVAELLEVDVHIAPLIDTALGSIANAVVIDDGQLIQSIRTGQLEIPGRLSLMRLDRLPSRRFGEKIQLDGVRGVIGRADRLVKCSDSVLPLIRYLLGTTWLVDSLDIALELSHFRGASLRFVTAECQLMDCDGTLTLGALQSSTGRISRRSEIQNAKTEIVDFKAAYQSSQGEIERLNGRIAKLIPSVQQLEKQAKELEKEFAHQQANAQNAVGKLDELEGAALKLSAQLGEYLEKRATVEPDIAQASEQVLALQTRVTAIENELNDHESIIRSHDTQLSAASEEQTSARIELARAEQRLEAVKLALEQCSRNQRERVVAVEEAEREVQRLNSKLQYNELCILELTSTLADDYLRFEAEEGNLEELAAQASQLRHARSTAAKRLDGVSRAIEKLVQRRQSSQLEYERFQDSSQAILKRFAEDYSIELEQLSQAERIEDEEERATLNDEAAALRVDVGSVGEINMAALAELDELQSRYDNLNGQYEDLFAAKESLQRIIQKINTDSRRMFMETLEIIRQNFQKLYRKSFGGGNADIVLEEGEDVLECGIDIIATPPGKTALSNSLLSGGEKALTAVALLLAIFQYRPSPFCVLDEVDAPFDEANIGRFVNVLTEFLDWTKFIIVTHSKKTMTASTTLYGVTMQESGVSKQVAVRFEDVNEKGEIISANESAARRRAA